MYWTIMCFQTWAGVYFTLWTYQIDFNSYMCLQGGTTVIHKISNKKDNLHDRSTESDYKTNLKLLWSYFEVKELNVILHPQPVIWLVSSASFWLHLYLDIYIVWVCQVELWRDIYNIMVTPAHPDVVHLISTRNNLKLMTTATNTVIRVILATHNSKLVSSASLHHS